MIKWVKLVSITLVLFIVSIWALLFFIPAPPLLINLSFSQAVYAEHEQLLRLTLSRDEKYRLFTPLAEMPEPLIAATLLQEDQYFYWHPGVNPLALLRACWQTYIQNSRRIGASTITMQVARMLYQINSKTVLGKVYQIIRALQLEAHYNKKQILEAYLNLAPYGHNIEGVGAASRIYFDKPTLQLSLPEIFTLVIIPQNPVKRHPHHDTLKIVRDKIFKRWLKQHPEDINKKSLMALPLQMRSIQAMPFLAPHFVNRVLMRDSAKNMSQQSVEPISHGQIMTTLDLGLQKIVERVSRLYLMRKNNLGINNTAVLLVDTRNMGIKAMLGSADFFNCAIAGQINGIEIKRSPGSTLKPFIYGLALDQGLIHPATILKDTPHSFGGYNPENFDNDFAGPIQAKNALILSRNIPAVFLADQLKNPSLYEFLTQAGISPLKPASYYGLALVLGGVELSMHELVSLYAALANDGMWQPLRFRQNEKFSTPKPLLSAEASFLVLDMLKDTPIPGENFPTVMTQSVAWKTGTSSGYRDAWTIGVVGPYVLAVWIGHFSNQGNPAFIGKEIAAPLFFEIIHAIQTQLGVLLAMPKHPRSMHLTKVAVCKASGMLPTRYCTDTELVWFIPGKSPIKTDPIYREIAIDIRTGLRACHFGPYTRFAIYEFWPSDLLDIFKRAGIQRRSPPPFSPSCKINLDQLICKESVWTTQIISPQTNVNYVIRINTPQPTMIPFISIVDADVTTLHWFLNETYLGKTTREQPFFWHAKPGHFIVRVVDEYGRSDARDLWVTYDAASSNGLQSGNKLT